MFVTSVFIGICYRVKIIVNEGHIHEHNREFLGELFQVFLGFKANARGSVHSPQDHFFIPLIISDRRD